MLPVCTPEMIQGAAQLLIYLIGFLGAFWTLLLGARSG
jgi:hypothetical protein